MVPYKQMITIKIVCDKIKGHASILSHLPNDPEFHVTRDYLFTIVNSFDHSFFKNAIEEIENKKMK